MAAHPIRQEVTGQACSARTCEGQYTPRLIKGICVLVESVSKEEDEEIVSLIYSRQTRTQSINSHGTCRYTLQSVKGV